MKALRTYYRFYKLLRIVRWSHIHKSCQKCIFLARWDQICFHSGRIVWPVLGWKSWVRAGNKVSAGGGGGREVLYMGFACMHKAGPLLQKLSARSYLTSYSGSHCSSCRGEGTVLNITWWGQGNWNRLLVRLIIWTSQRLHKYKNTKTMRPTQGVTKRCGGGGCGVSANHYSCTGAQINFGDLTPYLT
jgi:hypothetical protein